MEINTLKIGKILKVELNLSVLKFMYLGSFASDLSKLGLKMYVRVFSIEIKSESNNKTKAFCSVVNQTFLVLFGTPGISEYFAV